MANITEKITDPDSFHKYFNIIASQDVFANINKINYQIELVKYNPKEIIVQFPERMGHFNKALIYARYDDDTIAISVEVIETKDNKIFSAKPLLIQVLHQPRKEKRKEINQEGGTALHVTDLLSDLLILDSFSRNNKKLGLMQQQLEEQLNKTFDYVKVRFLSESDKDNRMKLFYSFTKPIHIADVNNKPDGDEEKELFEKYKSEIYNLDTVLISHKLISEYTIPIILKQLIAVGYIQVNSKKQFTDEEIRAVRKIGSSFSESFPKNIPFEPLTDKIIVSDCSKGGMSLLFTDRKALRMLKQNSLMMLTFVISEDKKATMLISVRNIQFEGKMVSVGCQIMEMDAISESVYQEFIDSLD